MNTSCSALVTATEAICRASCDATRNRSIRTALWSIKLPESCSFDSDAIDPHPTDFDFRGADVIAAFERRRDASPTVKALLARDHVAACYWTGEVRVPIPRLMS